MQQLESLSVSSGTTMPIYYDFEDNGQLTGGKLDTEIPLATPSLQQSLSDMPAYDSYTLYDNGPVGNRINLVFVGDGYTEAQMDLYWQHVENVIGPFLAESPLDRYADYFNVHVVEVISNESGIDEIDKNIYRDTALDMSIGCSGIDRLLCVDYSKAWTAAGNAPGLDVVLVLANSTRYGGAGYTRLCTLSGANTSAVELALHEFGHAFANLADEYHYSDGAVYEGQEPTQPNVSIYSATQLAAAQTKWYRWLDQGTVNTFEGAKYKQYGIYRPTSVSKMQTLDNPYGSVNSEQFLFTMYGEMSPIDQSFPAASFAASASETFSIQCPLPVPDTLEVTWQLDGQTIPGVNQLSFCPEDIVLPNTLHTLTVTVQDATNLVRDEERRDALMTDQRQWQIWEASADIISNGGSGLLDLMMMASAWLSDDSSYDFAPEGGDGLVDMMDISVLAAKWNNSLKYEPDGIVDQFDLMGMAVDWLSSEPDFDIAPPGGDGVVNMLDFSILSSQWAP